MADTLATSGAVRLIRLALAASLLLPVAAMAWASWASHQKVAALADERISRALDVEQEHAQKSLQIVGLVLDDAAEDLGHLKPEEFRAREQYFHELFLKRIRAVSEIQSIWLFDRDGYPVATSSSFPVSRSRNYAEEDYFRSHTTNDIGTYVGAVHQSQFGGEPFFTISRRVVNNGQFAGVLEVSVLPSDFSRFYTRMAYGEGLQYALLRDDGVFLARYPIPDGPLNPLGPSTGFRKKIAENSQGGFYTTTSPVDRVERRFGVRKLPTGLVYISAGVSNETMLNEWLSDIFPYLVVGFTGAVILFTTLLFVLYATKRLHVEMQRRETVEGTLRQAQRLDAVGQLTGGVAHDFNNLLTIIIGNLESAQRQAKSLSGAASTKLATTVDRAMLGAQRAATLTRRLLAFSRQQPLSPSPLDLNKLLMALPEFLKGGLGESISIEIVGAGGLWSVEADGTELEAAILNLAVNARDAMPDGGKLTIEASNTYLDEKYCRDNPEVRPGQYVQIAVSDSGSGMPPEVLARVFEPFFTTKESGHGTGLGLSQVYGFVRQSGGHLKMYSEVGEGTTAKIYLPRLVTSSSVEESPILRAPVGDTGEWILLVEDDLDVRTHLTETLQEMGYHVLEASNGEKALEILDAFKGKIDLLFTDVVMPGMNGRKLGDEAKTRRPDIKILFMTGYSRNAIVHHGRLDPGVDLIQKPIAHEQLATKIRMVLD